MLNVNELIGFGVGGGVPIEISYTGGGINNASGPYTFTSIPFGEPRADRLLVICAGTGHLGNGTVTGATIGGVTATLVVASNPANSGSSAIFVAAVPNGTSGDVVITTSFTNGACTCDVFRLVNASATPFNTAQIISPVSGTSQSLNINTADGGAVIGYANRFGSFELITWTNLTSRSARASELTNGSAASDTSTQGQTITVTASKYNTNLHNSLVLASFAPS